MKIYVPSNFHFENLFPNDLKNKDKYCYILHLIEDLRILNKTYEDDDSYVNIKSKLLEKIIGRYIPIRDNLIEKEVIECDNCYKIGEKSKGYRIKKKYRIAKINTHEITSEKIISNLEIAKNIMIQNIPNEIEYQYLLKNLQKIEIDKSKALEFVNSNYSGRNKKIIKKYNLYVRSIRKIYDKNFFIVLDKTGFRVHTNLTNLFKELRQFLIYKGESLINIDISNSQPFLFNMLIKKYLKDKNKENEDFFSSLDSFSSLDFFSSLDTNKYKSDNVNNYINPLAYNKFLSIITYVRQNEDILIYEKLTSEGKFYEYLMEKMEIDKNERNKFKKQVFGRIFFSTSEKSKKRQYIYWKKFKIHFPSVSEIIEYYKKDNYQQLAVELQKSESNIMINKVVRRIAIEKPNIFVSTIHDSILTTIDNQDYIKNLIQEEFRNQFNLIPSIKIEY